MFRLPKCQLDDVDLTSSAHSNSDWDLATVYNSCVMSSERFEDDCFMMDPPWTYRMIAKSNTNLFCSTLQSQVIFDVCNRSPIDIHWMVSTAFLRAAMAISLRRRSIKIHAIQSYMLYCISYFFLPYFHGIKMKCFHESTELAQFAINTGYIIPVEFPRNHNGNVMPG